MVLFSNMINEGAGHSSLYNLDVIYKIIYQNYGYWESIAPFTKDAPESIEEMKKVLHEVGYTNLSPDEGWKKIRNIAKKAQPQDSFFFSGKPDPILKELYKAILSDDLDSFEVKYSAELKSSKSEDKNCSIQ